VEQQLAADFVYVLEHFYRVWPAHRRRPLYLFGESYGGYFVTSIAFYIHQHNRRVAEGGDKPVHVSSAKTSSSSSSVHVGHINLVGIGLGNGAVDDFVQTKAYIDYGFFHGLIDSATATALSSRWQTCAVRAEYPKAARQGMHAIDGCMVGRARRFLLPFVFSFLLLSAHALFFFFSRFVCTRGTLRFYRSNKTCWLLRWRPTSMTFAGGASMIFSTIRRVGSARILCRVALLAMTT
jgi:hypothetical protein